MSQTMRIKSEVDEARTERIVLSLYVVSGLLLSSAVIASAIYLLLTLASAVVIRPGSVAPGPSAVFAVGFRCADSVFQRRT